MLDSGSWILGCGTWVFFVAGAPYLAIHVNKTLSNFFPAHFWSVPDFLEKNVYEPNFAQFFGDFQLAILLTVVMNLPPKMFVSVWRAFIPPQSWKHVASGCVTAGLFCTQEEKVRLSTKRVMSPNAIRA